MSRYILGGGIAGLITAYYNPEYTLVSDQLGGQMADTGLGPRILEVNENSATLLGDLGYDTIKVKTAKIGYMVCNQYLDHLGKSFRENYYMKSRYLKELKEVPKSVMSDGKNEIKYFDIDWNELIGKLLKGIKSHAILGRVSFIDTVNKEIIVEQEGEQMGYSYDKLLSTLPAPLFYKLSRLKATETLNFVPKTFIIVPEFFDMKDFDYVYFPGNEVEYHRVTKLGNGNVAVEYTTEVKSDTLVKDWTNVIDVKTLFGGQIQSGAVDYFDDIIFVGRYACWDHDLKTDDVVFQALLINDLDQMEEEVEVSE